MTAVANPQGLFKGYLSLASIKAALNAHWVANNPAPAGGGMARPVRLVVSHSCIYYCYYFSPFLLCLKYYNCVSFSYQEGTPEHRSLVSPFGTAVGLQNPSYPWRYTDPYNNVPQAGVWIQTFLAGPGQGIPFTCPLNALINNQLIVDFHSPRRALLLSEKLKELDHVASKRGGDVKILWKRLVDEDRPTTINNVLMDYFQIGDDYR